MRVPRSRLLEWIDRRAAPHRVDRLPRPVVSVGNLHWGGAGKTPFTEALARHLASAHHRVAILSRGYPVSPEAPVFASDWGRPLAGPDAVGDEPALLAERLPGVAVIVCAERALAGRAALERLDPTPDLFLLDDGFAHRRLARDIDLLLFPADAPLGGRWPLASFRQPLSAASRADAAIAHLSPDGTGTETLATALRTVGFEGPVFSCRRRTEAAILCDGERLDVDTPALAIAGLAHNDAFFEAAAEQGLRLVGQLGFRDHEPYGERTLRRIARAVDDTGAQALVTTDKDRVKLVARFAEASPGGAAEHLARMPLASVPLVSTPEPAVFVWLEQQLREHFEMPLDRPRSEHPRHPEETSR